jgi:hypothetical protein
MCNAGRRIVKIPSDFKKDNKTFLTLEEARKKRTNKKDRDNK